MNKIDRRIAMPVKTARPPRHADKDRAESARGPSLLRPLPKVKARKLRLPAVRHG